MKVHLTVGNWSMQKSGAQTVRQDVFVIEQNIPVELEWDEMDAACLHALAYDHDGQPIGTGRLLPDGHIGRMAVQKAARGGGVGSAIIEALMQQARMRGDHAVLLHAQTHAEQFYARYGFVREGDEFLEAGIPHIRMRHIFR
jgi:predicted GNAT family N-acyltransferase